MSSDKDTHALTSFMEDPNHSENFEYVRDGLKVRCKPTGQDFPTSDKGLVMLQQYVKSKTYLKAIGKMKSLDKEIKEKGLTKYWEKYEPHIIQHKKVKNALFCQLTGAELNKIEAEVEKHVNGKRFKRAKAEFEELVAKNGEIDDDEEENSDDEEDEEDSLSGIDEIDFAPSPKKQKTDSEASKKETDKIEKINIGGNEKIDSKDSITSKTKKSDAATKSKSDPLLESVVSKKGKLSKAEKKQLRKNTKNQKERLLVSESERGSEGESEDEAEEDEADSDSDEELTVPAVKKSTDSTAPVTESKKLNKKAKKRLGIESESTKPSESLSDSKVKSAKQKRLVNSKKRKAIKAKSETSESNATKKPSALSKIKSATKKA